MSLVQPSGDLSAKIREELREPDADAIAKDIVAIREWLDKQPHLPKDMGEYIISSERAMFTYFDDFSHLKNYCWVFT